MGRRWMRGDEAGGRWRVREEEEGVREWGNGDGGGGNMVAR